MGFNFAAPPDMEMPATLQTIITIELAVVAAIFAFIALRDFRKTGSPIGPLLLVGGFFAAINEGNVDALGHVWHPRDGSWELYETIGPVPLWVGFAYLGFEGGVAFMLYKRAKRGITTRQLWIFFGCLMAANVAFEIPLLAAGLYDYYGNPPLEVFGMPLMWPPAALAPVLITVALLTRVPQLFAGWRKIILLIEPAIAFGAVSGAVGWPAQSVLHMENESELLNQLGGLATMGLAIGLVAILISVVAVDGALNRGASADSDRLAEEPVMPHRDRDLADFRRGETEVGQA